MSLFQKATKSASYLRLAISGPSGSGKTYTALSIALGLSESVAFIDTEHGSASKYADLFDFDVVNMPAPYHPDKFCQMIDGAVAAGYKVVVIDSLSHAWNGAGGLLEIVDAASTRAKGNGMVGWKEATPIHQRLIEKIVSAPIHIITTMRSKMEYVIEKDDRGKSAPRKVGMAPIQRDGMEYEFDVWMEMDIDNNALVQKSRCPELHNAVIPKPGKVVADTLAAWLNVKGLPATVPTPAPSGDGHKGEPPVTHGQKIEDAKAYLDKASASTVENWAAALGKVDDKIQTWPAPHGNEIRRHANALAAKRGEEPVYDMDDVDAIPFN